MSKLSIKLACALAVVGLSTSVQAAQGIGEAVVVKQQVSGAGVAGNRRLVPSDPVYSNERISAGADSHGELQLNDNSKIIVGENSTVTLDNFAVGGGGFNKGAMKVVRGAFRFVSGSSAKGTFSVRTPMATVGVRGTIFDVYVDGEKELFVLFSGAIQVCTNAGVCEIASRSCDVIQVTSPSDISKEPFFGSARSTRQKGDVALAEGQQRFSKSWRAPLRPCQARAAMEAVNGIDGNDPEIPEPHEPDSRDIDQ